MADNYLEKKMEEHRNGGSRYTPRHTPAGRKPGFALLPYTIKSAFIESDTDSTVLTSIAREIRETGCRVAISCPGRGAEIAQKTSCAFVPPGANSIQAISDKWGEVELIIRIERDTVTLLLGRGNSTIRKSESCDEETFAKRAAQLCVYLSLPDSDGRVFGEFLI